MGQEEPRTPPFPHPSSWIQGSEKGSEDQHSDSGKQTRVSGSRDNGRSPSRLARLQLETTGWPPISIRKRTFKSKPSVLSGLPTPRVWKVRAATPVEASNHLNCHSISPNVINTPQAVMSKQTAPRDPSARVAAWGALG